jgi:hypothetical protein
MTETTKDNVDSKHAAVTTAINNAVTATNTLITKVGVVIGTE